MCSRQSISPLSRTCATSWEVIRAKIAVLDLDPRDYGSRGEERRATRRAVEAGSSGDHDRDCDWETTGRADARPP